MSFYFVWVRPDEPFNPVLHRRQDEHILHFDIDHQEGSVPLLRLSLSEAHHVGQEIGGRGILWQQEGHEAHVLFDGVVRVSLGEKKGGFLLLVLEAGSLDNEKRLEAHLEAVRQECFEPLLVAEENHHQVYEILEAHSSLPHWDRVTGELTLSPLAAEEGHVLSVGPNFFEDSLELTQRDAPLSGLKISITAEWVQRYDGVVDLSPLIKQEGHRGYLSTLTPKDFQRKWWRKDYPLARTGYEILESRLTPLVPPPTGGLGLYPLKSSEFIMNGKPQSLERVWFEPCLKLQWHYRQKRKETVHVTVPFGGTGPTVELSLKLQDISSPISIDPWKPNVLYAKKKLVVWKGDVYGAREAHRSGEGFEEVWWRKKSAWPTALEDASQASFFQTERGRAVVDHVLKRAHAYHLMVCRRLFIRCRMSFEQGRSLRCDQSVCLKGDRLPGGEVTGRVVHYRLVVEGDVGEKWAELTIAVSSQRPCQWTLDRLVPKSPVQGIQNPGSIRAEDLVTAIQLTHDGNLQNHLIEGKRVSSFSEVHRLLEGSQTRLRIELKDLKPTEELHHDWNAEIKNN